MKCKVLPVLELSRQSLWTCSPTSWLSSTPCQPSVPCCSSNVQNRFAPSRENSHSPHFFRYPHCGPFIDISPAWWNNDHGRSPGVPVLLGPMVDLVPSRVRMCYWVGGGGLLSFILSYLFSNSKYRQYSHIHTCRYGLGIPLFVFVILVKNRHRLDEPIFRMMFSALYLRYNRRRWGIEKSSKARKH